MAWVLSIDLIAVWRSALGSTACETLRCIFHTGSLKRKSTRIDFSFISRLCFLKCSYQGKFCSSNTDVWFWGHQDECWKPCAVLHINICIQQTGSLWTVVCVFLWLHHGGLYSFTYLFYTHTSFGLKYLQFSQSCLNQVQVHSCIFLFWVIPGLPFKLPMVHI